MKRRVFALALVLVLAFSVAVAAPASRSRPAPSSSPREAVERMLARLLRAPEFPSRVFITRSDPFGGPGEVTEGRIWFLPGRGLRFRSMEQGGEDIVPDKENGEVFVYPPTERVADCLD